MPIALVNSAEASPSIVNPAASAPVCLAPGRHHEGVVDGHADDLVHALGVEIVLGPDESSAHGQRCRCRYRPPAVRKSQPCGPSAFQPSKRFPDRRLQPAAGLHLVGCRQRKWSWWSSLACLVVPCAYRVPRASCHILGKHLKCSGSLSWGPGRPARPVWPNCGPRGSPARSPSSGKNTHRPTSGPPLSKAYLLGDMALERLYLRPMEATTPRTGST
jgi:hypothetical protein